MACRGVFVFLCVCVCVCFFFFVLCFCFNCFLSATEQTLYKTVTKCVWITEESNDLTKMLICAFLIDIICPPLSVLKYLPKRDNIPLALFSLGKISTYLNVKSELKTDKL